jgi:predicted GNAT family acetyltransferase
MSQGFLDISNERAVIRAIEENMFSYWMAYGRLEGRKAVEDERLLYFLTDIPHPLFNAVFRAQLTVNQLEPTIREIVDIASQHQLPLFWWTGPETLPSDLGSHLEKHGLHRSGYTPGMAADLNALPEAIPVPDGFHITAVEDQHTLRQWVETLLLGNEMPPSFSQLIYELESSRGIDSSVLRRYLGILNGEPVAASALHLDVGVAGIYAVATIPHARGQGIGAAVTLQALLDARVMGYRVGVLQASSMGYPVYKRMGFKDLCQLEIYYFQPK